MKPLLIALLLSSAIGSATCFAQEMQVGGTMDGQSMTIQYNPNDEIIGYSNGQDYITQLTPSTSPYSIFVNGVLTQATGDWGPFTITSPPVEVGAGTDGPITLYRPLPGTPVGDAGPAPTGVPEPDMLVLFALGLAVVVGYRIKRGA